MKSIKPGRGPSAMGAVGSIFAAFFGVFWTITTIKMGAPIFFSLFGVFFVIIAIVQGIYNYKNATSKNRMSIYDITDDDEESDMFNDLINNKESNFCSNCGEKLEGKYKYCPKCGQKL